MDGVRGVDPLQADVLDAHRPEAADRDVGEGRGLFDIGGGVFDPILRGHVGRPGHLRAWQ